MCGVINFCAWSCDTDEIRAYDTVVIEDLKKRKDGKHRNFYKNVHVKYGLEVNS